MILTQREHDAIELRAAERSLATVIDPGRQTEPTEAGREYRRKAAERIAELRARLERKQEAVA